VLGDKQYAGKVVIDAAPKLQGTSLTFILDWAAGGKDPVRNFDKGIEEMKKIAPGVQTWDPKPEPYIPVMNGQAVLGIGYNARAQYYSDQSKGRMKVTVPKEGTVFQINSINLVKGAPNKDAALQFINYALGPQAQKDFAELMFYAPTNVNASVSPEALLRTVMGQMDRVISVDWVEYAKVRDKLDEAWRRQVIPLSQ
jgi:putative spermidine/putrescine transport system substrate-binding protein